MVCKVSECYKEVRYKKDGVCQMHYFRMMRNGKYDLLHSSEKKPKKPRKAVYRRMNSNGYVLIREPNHQLAQSNGYVYEHRFVLFNAKGGAVSECEMCGKPWSWNAIYYSHVDHIDKDKTNNSTDNLRPLCNSCNTQRDLKPFHSKKSCLAIEIDGLTMTSQEWSRSSGCTVSGATIARRIRGGVSPRDAVYTPSKTYKGNARLCVSGLMLELDI